MAETLLQKALKAATPSPITRSEPEMIELALAWATDKITHSQVCKALDLKSTTSSAHSRLCIGLRQTIRQGILVVKK